MILRLFLPSALRAGALLCAAMTQTLSAAPAMTLGDYLAAAREAGVNIIYATSLVSLEQPLNVDADRPFSLDVLRSVLATLRLELQEISPDVYVLRRSQGDAVVATPVADDTPGVIEEVVVHSSVYRWARRTDSGTYLNGEALVRRPVIANDVLRVANQLPGSASVGVSARPRVRGGSEDETLIEFDRVRLYNPFHFASYNTLYSAFDERLVAELDFYSGAYPLNLGDSLSAAMAISPPGGEDIGNRREIGIGLYQLSYQHSVVSGRDAWLANLRRSGPETGHLLDEDALGHPEFGDAFFRFERTGDDGSSWSANLLWYGDDLQLGGEELGESVDSRYGSGYAWASLLRDIGQVGRVATILGAGYLDNRREGLVHQSGKVEGQLKSSLDLATIFANQDYEWGEDGTVFSAGWDYRYTTARYGVFSAREVSPAFGGLGDPEREGGGSYSGRQHAHQGAVYAGWKHRAAAGLYLDLGLRVDAQGYDSRMDVEPAYRFALLYEATPGLDLRLAVGHYTQAQALSDLPVADLDTAIPAPQAARQWVLSLDWSLPVFDAGLRVEAYRKDARRVNSYYANLSNGFTLLPELQPDRVRVDADSYRAQGIELSVDVPLQWGDFWFNYAYSAADDRIDGYRIARGWDQGRTLNSGIQTTLGKWDIALSGSFHEGWLTTPLFLEGDSVVAGSRNSQRFDHFLSVDAKAIRRWRWRGSEFRVELGLSNITDRANIVGFDYTLPEPGTLVASSFLAPTRTAVLDLYWAF